MGEREREEAEIDEMYAMTETRQDQINRHKALDAQWWHANRLKWAAMELRNANRIYGALDPKTESDLRAAEEVIADIRAQFPRKGSR